MFKLPRSSCVSGSAALPTHGELEQFTVGVPAAVPNAQDEQQVLAAPEPPNPSGDQQPTDPGAALSEENCND